MPETGWHRTASSATQSVSPSVAIALAFMSETNPSNPPRELKIPLSRA